MKHLLANDLERDMLKMCYDVVYSYSHQRFNEFINIPEITIIIKLISSAVGIDKLINNNASLQLHAEDKYKKHIAELFDKV